MPHTSLQAIVEREIRAFFLDHVALVALLVLVGGVLAALVR